VSVRRITVQCARANVSAVRRALLVGDPVRQQQCHRQCHPFPACLLFTCV